MISRRAFATGCLGMAASLSAPAIVRATPSGVVGVNRLWVIRAYDGGTLDAPIFLKTKDGSRQAWKLWSHFWRDVKDHDKGVYIDMQLLARMNGVQMEMSRQRGEEVPLILTSGYRTPERNATIEGAAQHSQHCVGRAADFNGRGFTPRQTADIIERHPVWRSGGLGRYPNFTHLDTARQRRWGSN